MSIARSVFVFFVLFLCHECNASLFQDVRDVLQDNFLRLAHRWSAPSHSLHKRDTGEEEPKKVNDRRTYARVKFVQCGDETDPIHVEEFKIKPNPLVIPGTMEVGIALNVHENQSAPIPVELEMSKKVTLLFGLSSWFRIPCLSNGVGSCEYEDLCNLPLFAKGLCQNSLDTSKCGCPLAKGNYTSKVLTFDVPQVPENVPDYLLHGEVYVKAIVKKDEQQLACYSTNVDISDKSERKTEKEDR